MTQHQCDGQYATRTLRLLLALLDDNEGAVGAMQVIDAELGGCGRCWRAMALWLAQQVAGDRALQARTVAGAAELVLAELKRITE